MNEVNNKLRGRVHRGVYDCVALRARQRLDWEVNDQSTVDARMVIRHRVNSSRLVATANGQLLPDIYSGIQGTLQEELEYA